MLDGVKLFFFFAGQVLSRALGGKTGRASVGWEVGLRDICLTDAFFSKSYAAGMPPKLKVLEVHRDQVIDTALRVQTKNNKNK